MYGSVKNKIRGGTIFLFFLVVLSASFSIYYLARNRQQLNRILEANFESLEYGHAMQVALDSLQHGNRQFSDSFENKLKLQENNITEKGEARATGTLRQAFNRLRRGNGTTAEYALMRAQLQRILHLNMAAIKNKSDAAEAAAENAMTYLVMIASLIFLIGLSFVYSFPSIVTAPIRKLTEAIKKISAKNYAHRIHIDSKDEFGTLARAFNEMAERLEFFESSNLNKILFEKERAEAVINSLKDASIGIDKTDTVLFANNQALQLLSLQPKDIVGQPVHEVIKRNDLFHFLMDENGTAPFKIVVENRENYFIKEVLAVGQDGAGSKVIVLKNITSFKELDVAKTAFIATISHELKTPLASSDFSLKLLEDARVGNLTKEQNDLVQALKHDNQRMLRILSELLNLSQAETGKIKLDIQAISPYRLVDDSVQAIASAARERELKIEKKLEPGLPQMAADPDKTAWVLNNFLTNAVKYAPERSAIRIEVKKENRQLNFSVTDSGPGIDEIYLGRLFERYFQVPGRSGKGGTGIGLAICKELIEAMGGTVWVKSRLGEGSVFGFTLLLE